MDFSGPYTRPTSPVSRIDWNGASPQKFRLSERLHFIPKDLLRSVEASDASHRGRRHFSSKPVSPEREFSAGIRVFPEVSNRQTDTSNFSSFGKLAYVNPQKKMLWKLKVSAAEALKQIKAKSLVMPPSFSSIKEQKKERNSLVFGPPRNAKARQTPQRLNWRERERVEEKNDDMRNVKDLTRWENSLLGGALNHSRRPSPAALRDERFRL